MSVIRFKKLPGVHTPHHKNTAAMPAVDLPVPAEVRIPMSMHIGAPAKPLVSVGDEVKVGQMIGEAAGNISAHVHSSVSGTVSAILPFEPVTGETGIFIVIKSDGLQTPLETLTPPEVTDTESFLTAVRASGIVGLGGAGFPTAAKLTLRESSKVDYIIINGAECEPYITSDTRTMIDDAELIWAGAAMLKQYLGVGKVIMAVEDNKKEAITALKKFTHRGSAFQVQSLSAIYPQGGEKMLIYNLTGRSVPEGKLPLDAGVIVINCTTLAAIARYIKTGMPLVSKCVTVDGPAVKNPRNLTVPIGTPVAHLLDFCGVPGDEVKKVLYGGPMMGAAIPDLSFPVKKTTNAITVMDENNAQIPVEQSCIRCARCVNNCPMRLMSMEIQNAYLANKPELLEAYKVSLCIECGCCTFNCPAKRPVTQYMRLSKMALRKFQTARDASGKTLRS